ncbi:MAG: PIN domain-containing protein [Candidatus Micrarchaeia archaeon]
MAIDTSSILFCYENGIDIFDTLKFMGYKSIVSRGVIRELEKKAIGNSGKKSYAKLALEAIKTKHIYVEKSDEYVDNWIKEKAAIMPVCTNDIELKRELKKRGVKVFTASRGGKIRQ